MSTMNYMPEQLKPYERCQKYGPEVLNDAELLAVLLRTGTYGESAVELAQRIISDVGANGLDFLYRISIPELMRIKGIGEVKATQIVCLGELSKRISQNATLPSIDFHNPKTIVDYYREKVKGFEQERVWALFLDTKFHLLHETELSLGTVNMAVITPREVLIESLKYRAVSLILMHNHPSGDPNPSKEDIDLTRRMTEAGKIVGVNVLDHIIIGYNRYYSFAEHSAMGTADSGNMKE